MKESTADEIVASIGGVATKESLAIQKRLVADKLKTILSAVNEGEELTAMDKLVYDCLSQYAPFGGERHMSLKDLKNLHDIVDDSTELEISAKTNTSSIDASLNEIRLRKKV